MLKKLTGIERELVLKYLQDANIPVTVTPLESLPESGVHSPTSVVFPVAFSGDKLSVLNRDGNGIILLKNPPEQASLFAGKMVRVEFYFNRVGLCFNTKMEQVSTGLALVVPAEISRISETPIQKTNTFTAEISYETGGKKNISILCPAASGYSLFSKPVWSSIPLEKGQAAKKYLEKFVAEMRGKENFGNGVQLIPVCQYLVEKDDDSQIKSVQGRTETPEVLYVNHECIVFGLKSENSIFKFSVGLEFNLKLNFPIDLKPAPLTREVLTECKVLSVFADDSEKRNCAVCHFTFMKEEDIRFVYEMTTKNLFI